MDYLFGSDWLDQSQPEAQSRFSPAACPMIYLLIMSCCPQKSAKDNAVRTNNLSAPRLSQIAIPSLPLHQEYLGYFFHGSVGVHFFPYPTEPVSLSRHLPSLHYQDLCLVIGQAPPMNALEPRQAPAVIATSDFLRRGYQACKF